MHKCISTTKQLDITNHYHKPLHMQKKEKKAATQN